MRLTRETLKGIFAAVPVPWDERGNFLEDVFRHDVAALCRAGVHGIYTTGTTGEFYALDAELFRRLVDAFLEESKQFGTLTQVGCTGTNTRAVVGMAEYAAARGADGVQVAFPFWMPLNDSEVVRFFRDVGAACAPLPVTHYNSGRTKRALGAREYGMILPEVPALIGSKFGSSDFAAVSELIFRVPEMAHFVGEHMLLPSVAMGARGCYSSLVLLNPRLTVNFFELCEAGRWEAAFDLQRKINRFFIEALFPLFEEGLNDAAIDKAMAAVGGLLRCPLAVAPPYTPPSATHVEKIKRYLEENFPEALNLNHSISHDDETGE